MRWSEQCWQAAQPVYDKILQLAFIKELINGRLAQDKFLFYIRQDALYLAEFGKVLAGISSKLENPVHSQAFLSFAYETIQVENGLHESFFRAIGKNELPEASPSCLLYTSYLQRQLAKAPVEVAAAAVLPCFWIYREVGDYILANQVKEENPYQSWIDTYGGEEYARSVDQAIGICNELAGATTEEMRKAMTATFVMGSRMEWMFWESAYRIEQWPV